MPAYCGSDIGSMSKSPAVLSLSAFASRKSISLRAKRSLNKAFRAFAAGSFTFCAGKRPAVPGLWARQVALLHHPNRFRCGQNARSARQFAHSQRVRHFLCGTEARGPGALGTAIALLHHANRTIRPFNKAFYGFARYQVPASAVSGSGVRAALSSETASPTSRSSS